MFFINYDLAKQILNERRATAMAQSARRAGRHNGETTPMEAPEVQAEVIELTFAPACEHEKLGA